MESDLIPCSASPVIPARRVLVLAPHPDDEVFGCGGAISLHVRQGTPVEVVILTDGAAGAGDPADRENESRAAAAVLGYGQPVFWRLPDRGLHCAEALVERLANTISAMAADLVYAPSPWEVHPDHRQAALLATEAVRRVTGSVRLAFYEIGAPLRPNLLLDIGPVLETKARAMQCFASQLAQQDYARQLTALNQYRTYSLPHAVAAAEAFLLLEAAELASFMAAAGSSLVAWAAHPGSNALTAQPPLVSILIRSTDRAYLAEALDSVALQTWPNIEVLVVAATPGHQALPARCGRFPLRLLTTDAALRRSAAANRALAEAHGDFLLFLDDDDWLMPSHVARLAQVLSQQPHALAAYTGISLVDAAGRPLGQAFELPFDAIRQQAGNLTPIHAVLFSARVLAQGCRFDETLDRYEDWDFWLQLGRLGPMVHVPGVSGAYRIHDSSGVHADAGPLGDATARIYQKWQQEWTPETMGSLMQRVWSHTELETQLATSRQQLAATQEAAEHDRRVMTQAIEQQQQQLEQQRQGLEQTTAYLAGVLNSRSWRVTRPLRQISAWLQRPTRLQRLRDILAAEGWRGLSYRLRQRWPSSGESRAMDYGRWVREYDTPTPDRLAQQRKSMAEWRHTPLISIVMPVYNPPLELLKEAVHSVQAQIYPHWELCIADDASPDEGVWRLLQELAGQDGRIRLVRRGTNGHISHASNSALELAQGEFVALMDNDDLLPADALYWVAQAVNQRPTVQVIYSDEDKLDAQGQRFGPYFKPDWNYTLFLGHNLISHLGVYRTRLMRDVGGFRAGFEGSQDYDLALRCIERVAPAEIAHIPRVLYHWRAIEGSTALATEAKPYALTSAQRALQEHRQRIGQPAEVTILPSWNYHCQRPDPGATDRLSLVLVRASDAATGLPAPAWTAEPAFGVHEVLSCTADAASIQAALNRAQGTLVALVRADLQPAGPQALLELARHALEPGTGMAAGTVRDTAGRLVTGGLILNSTTVAAVLLPGLPEGNTGYMGRGLLTQELSAAAMDCMVMRKRLLETSVRLDETLGISPPGAAAACLQLREQGLRIVWCPQAVWTETESARRPAPEALEALRRAFMTRYGKRYAGWLQHDPAYHPLLDAVRADFTLQAPAT